ncbi:MAG TPA: ABC transporter ATP-binding protein [Zoogloea sp.]|jgi:branched-chain amino acid transport system ATP-binding protein|uniref:ABC transporter ATP-binding protein n=1 Tax=Zoogloea sp. TaxID=49181 RepID=UPI001B43A049|nr:ABC transporter ATP-binding protein [Zoogloea sp.]MBP8266816.1 ABC transporter ATP-binding protein [Zoogloea sp.]HOB45326.1 ABC transporter ATP-binding protein [Zoogloea sp.]HQA09235.1 ABC transporter ATP-binding protein [Zoogloea sp.]HQE38322.1 ABC transporter ATP-binding protein [Zoogloea sp.]
MSLSAAPLLELDRISLSFKGVKAITDISFAVARGEICALIGPNGAGKSSLLNVINGVYQAQQGRVCFDGEVRRHMRPHHAAERGIARTFQNIALFKGMTVLDNVLTGRNLKRRSSWIEQALGIGRAHREDDVQRRRAEEVIAFLNIQAWRQSPVGTLPYGLQKRVELARALAAEPKLLLLDEPMAGMNASEKKEMSRFIVEINREFGTTVVLIEHDIGVVMGISSHVVVLDYGRKIGDGPPDEVRANPEVIAAYLGTRH